MSERIVTPQDLETGEVGLPGEEADRLLAGPPRAHTLLESLAAQVEAADDEPVFLRMPIVNPRLRESQMIAEYRRLTRKERRTLELRKKKRFADAARQDEDQAAVDTAADVLATACLRILALGDDGDYEPVTSPDGAAVRFDHHLAAVFQAQGETMPARILQAAFGGNDDAIAAQVALLREWHENPKPGADPFGLS